MEDKIKKLKLKFNMYLEIIAECKRECEVDCVSGYINRSSIAIYKKFTNKAIELKRQITKLELQNEKQT